jgi:hypothetical protein
MRKLFAKDLKIKFIETLNELDEFSYEEGNPFLIKIGRVKYYIFLKNLSPAYFKNSPDVTRVQLPYSDHFSKIFKANIPFIIFGYDVDTDTVVTWNPLKIRERLNAKSNVSLYSRLSLQEDVKADEFKLGFLSNNEKIVLFKRANLKRFFNVSSQLFADESSIKSFIQYDEIDSTSDIDNYKIWLQKKYSAKSVKGYTYGLNKIYSDLKEISALKCNSLFEIQNPEILKNLYDRWYSVKDYKDHDKVKGKYMYSNAFKRYIAFREHQQRVAPNAAAMNQVSFDPEITYSHKDLIDKEIHELILPFLKKNQVLHAVEIVSKHYGNKYENMEFKDWYRIIVDLYKKINL